MKETLRQRYGRVRSELEKEGVLTACKVPASEAIRGRKVRTIVPYRQTLQYLEEIERCVRKKIRKRIACETEVALTSGRFYATRVVPLEQELVRAEKFLHSRHSAFGDRFAQQRVKRAREAYDDAEATMARIQNHLMATKCRPENLAGLAGLRRSRR